MSKILELKKGPYWSAASKFGWGLALPGIGINLKLLEGEGFIDVKVGDDPETYRYSKGEAKEFARLHNSYHTARRTKLAVVPWEKKQ